MRPDDGDPILSHPEPLRPGVCSPGSAAQPRQEKKRRLLVIGQSKGYQHESISTAMVTLYNLGREPGQWDTYFRTDCTAITKKPLKWGAKNLERLRRRRLLHRRRPRHGRRHIPSNGARLSGCVAAAGAAQLIIRPTA